MRPILPLAVGVGVLSFIVLAALVLHWRQEASDQRDRAEAAQRQTRADAASAAASDAAARDVRIILQTGLVETRNVQTLPGAQTPIDPGRRGRRTGVAEAEGRLRHPAFTHS